MLYRSLANVGYSINSNLAGINGVASGAANTLGAEWNAITGTFTNPLGMFSNAASQGSWAGSTLGSWLYPSNNAPSNDDLDTLFDGMSDLFPDDSMTVPTSDGGSLSISPLMTGGASLRPIDTGDGWTLPFTSDSFDYPGATAGDGELPQ